MTKGQEQLRGAAGGEGEEEEGNKARSSPEGLCVWGGRGDGLHGKRGFTPGGGAGAGRSMVSSSPSANYPLPHLLPLRPLPRPPYLLQPMSVLMSISSCMALLSLSGFMCCLK